MTDSAPFLSLILPVFNGAHYIDASIRDVLAELHGLDRPFEVIVVCDGSVDGTAETARAVGDPQVRVLHYRANSGKGFAIVHGLLEARGRLVGWLDADLDVHPRTIREAAAIFEDFAVDAVIGSKRHRFSDVRYPLVRRVYSWGFQMLVRLLFRVNVRDTQVGAKVFRREMLDTVVPLLLVKRWAFDVEVLAVGAEFGFDRIAEAPVELHYRFSGTSIDWRAVWWMFWDTIAIAYRIHVRRYYVRQFARLQRERMDATAAEALPR